MIEFGALGPRPPPNALPQTGHQLGEASALAVASKLRAGDPDRADALWCRARAIVQACGASDTVLSWPGWPGSTALCASAEGTAANLSK